METTTFENKQGGNVRTRMTEGHQFTVFLHEDKDNQYFKCEKCGLGIRYRVSIDGRKNSGTYFDTETGKIVSYRDRRCVSNNEIKHFEKKSVYDVPLDKEKLPSSNKRKTTTLPDKFLHDLKEASDNYNNRITHKKEKLSIDSNDLEVFGRVLVKIIEQVCDKKLKEFEKRYILTESFA